MKKQVWRTSLSSRKGVESCSLRESRQTSPLPRWRAVPLPPLRQGAVPAKPPSPVTSAEPAKATAAKPPKKARGSVAAALAGAASSDAAAPAAASPAGPPVPAPKAAGTSGAAHGNLAKIPRITDPVPKSLQPKTPPKGSRPPPKLPSSSSDWRPSLRGDEARDRSAERPPRLCPRRRGGLYGRPFEGGH